MGKSQAGIQPTEGMKWSEEAITEVISRWPCNKADIIALFETVAEDGGENSVLYVRLLAAARRKPGCIRRVCGPLDKMSMTRSAYQLMERVTDDHDVRCGQTPMRTSKVSRSADGVPSSAFYD